MWRKFRPKNTTRPLIWTIACVFACVASLAFSFTPAKEELITLATRYDSKGHEVTVNYFLDLPEHKEARSILIVLPGGNGVIKLMRGSNGTITHSTRHDLFMRLSSALRDRTIGLVVVDAPSDKSNGMTPAFRRGRAHREDIERAVKDLRTRHPSVRIYLGGSDAGGISALSAAAILGGDLSGVILAGVDYSDLYAYDLSGVEVPVLILHHLEDGCDSSSVVDAKQLADKYAFTFVPFSGGSDMDNNPCSLVTKHGLLGLEERAMAVIEDWMEGKRIIPASPDGAKVFLNEQILWVPMKDWFREIRLQTTVFKPDGPGPFPVAIISHGVPINKATAANVQRRLRYSAQAREFVRQGFVVAIPMRRGYGRSGGTMNQITFKSIHAFGLRDAEDIEATINFMSRQPYVDGKRMVLVGQSAGGLASLAYGSLGDGRVKGVINFAGGFKRTGKSVHWDLEMAEAFGAYAKTTKVLSIWFYTKNDSFFPPQVAGQAYDEYQKHGGKARLYALAPFKKDGHSLFGDPEGKSIWAREVERFLEEIGFNLTKI